MINADFILNEWVPALESGKIDQCTGHLGRGATRCCLGVAAELAAPHLDGAVTINQEAGIGSLLVVTEAIYEDDRENSSNTGLTPSISEFIFGQANPDGSMSWQFIDWLKTNGNGHLVCSQKYFDDSLGDLATMNDNEKSFEEIAQVLRLWVQFEQEQAVVQ